MGLFGGKKGLDTNTNDSSEMNPQLVYQNCHTAHRAGQKAFFYRQLRLMPETNT